MSHGKKPKARKMRKKPKAKASNKVKENWIKDRKALTIANKKRLSDWEAKKKKGESLTNQISGL